MTIVQNVAVNNLASLMVWKICQEYQYCLGQKDHWEAKLRKITKIHRILVAITVLLVIIVLVYWLANIVYMPVGVIILVAAAIGVLWTKEKISHYKRQLEQINSGVVEFLKRRMSQILLAHTCFVHDDLDAIVDFYCDQIYVVVGDFFKKDFTSPLAPEEEEEIKSWLKTSWPDFFTSP